MYPLDISILCNPYSGEPFRREGDQLVGLTSGQRYPIRDGIPVILPPRLPRRAAWYRRFYDTAAPLYDSVLDLGSRLGINSENEIRAKMVAHLPIQPGQRVLETATGTGANLATLPAGAEIYATDLSWGMLRRAHKKLARAGREAHLFQVDDAFLPFRDESFDHILHMGGLQFYADPFKAVSELARVARPGTTVTILDEADAAYRLLRKMPVHAEYAPDIPTAVQNIVRLVPFTIEDFHAEMIPGTNYYQLTFTKPAYV